MFFRAVKATVLSMSLGLSLVQPGHGDSSRMPDIPVLPEGDSVVLSSSHLLLPSRGPAELVGTVLAEKERFTVVQLIVPPGLLISDQSATHIDFERAAIGESAERWRLPSTPVAFERFLNLKELSIQAFDQEGNRVESTWHKGYGQSFLNSDIAVRPKAADLQRVDGGFSIQSEVMVADLAFEKQVVLVYSVDEGQTWQAARAEYDPGVVTKSWDLFRAEVIRNSEDFDPSETPFLYYWWYDVAGETFFASDLGQPFSLELD